MKVKNLSNARNHKLTLHQTSTALVWKGLHSTKKWILRRQVTPQSQGSINVFFLSRTRCLLPQNKLFKDINRTLGQRKVAVLSKHCSTCNSKHSLPVSSFRVLMWTVEPQAFFIVLKPGACAWVYPFMSFQKICQIITDSLRMPSTHQRLILQKVSRAESFVNFPIGFWYSVLDWNAGCSYCIE